MKEILLENTHLEEGVQHGAKLLQSEISWEVTNISLNKSKFLTKIYL